LVKSSTERAINILLTELIRRGCIQASKDLKQQKTCNSSGWSKKQNNTLHKAKYHKGMTTLDHL
jgi:hypothetical protein